MCLSRPSFYIYGSISTSSLCLHTTTTATMKVQIHSRKLIKPSTPTPTHLQTFSISSIDQIQPPFYITLIFHFKFQQTAATSKTLEKLEASLADVLSLYYPFAGRFEGESTVVSCQDQGVEFVKATADGKLCELLDGDYDAEILLAGLSISGVSENPLIMIQVTAFNCGGLSIGFCCYHKIADMFTISTFMDAWATTSRLGTVANSIHPSFDIPSLLPPKDVALVRTPPPLMGNDGLPLPPPKFVTKRFIFKGDTLSKLKLATVDTESGVTYTRVELVTALMSKAIINIDGLKYGRLRPYVIAHMVNLRKRIPFPVKENSCGNLYMVVRATQQMENQPLELQGIARLVHTSIRTFTSEIATLKEGVAISLKAESAVKELDKEMEKGEDVNLMMFSSWCRFSLYCVDFGWGTPELVKPLSTPFVSVGLMDSKDDADGMEAWVCLKEGDMIRFQHDSDILAHAL